MEPNQIVVISGAVGSGKSSSALTMAEILRLNGRSPAVIDLDLVYMAARPGLGFSATGWEVARRGAGALANSFLQDGRDTVIIEGEFSNADEILDVLQSAPLAKRCTRLTLLVSFEEALRNVSVDPNRAGSDTQNEAVLQGHYSRFTESVDHLRQHTIVVEVAGRSLEELSAELANTVLADANDT